MIRQSRSHMASPSWCLWRHSAKSVAAILIPPSQSALLQREFFPSRRITPYIVAQLAGAIVAVYVLLVAYGGPVNNFGIPLIDTQRITYGGAFMFEAVGTGFLVARSCTPPSAVERTGAGCDHSTRRPI